MIGERASIIVSHLISRDDPATSFVSFSLTAVRHFHHLGVTEHAMADAGGGIGDGRDAEDAHAARARDDHLGHGAHPDRVGAEPLEHADLGRRFVGRPEQGA